MQPFPSSVPARKGFTLIETLVAITILAVSIVGPFYAIQSALTASYISRDSLIASSLAQEGLEYVRSVRDDNYLSGRSWLDQLSSYGCYATLPATPGRVCTVDPTQGDPHTSSPPAIRDYSDISSVPYLHLSPAGLYNQQDSGGATAFKRTIQLFGVSANEVRVVVTVTWVTKNMPYSTTLQDSLFNWL
jgi:prepilin-type N-terminal cleavage/methylation domain-containing protein